MLDLSTVPQCGIACLASSLSSTACDPADQACLCLDQLFSSTVERCVLSSCTVEQQLLTKNATWSGCDFPEENDLPALIIITSVLISLQLIFFSLRMLGRIMKLAPWGWDDTTIVIAFAAIVCWVGAAVIEGRNGLGRNIWTLTPEQIRDFLRIFWIFEVLYSASLCILKISIVFLYMRIFPDRKFRIVLWATQAVLAALLVAFLIADGFQCQPLSYFANYWDGQHEGTCFNFNAFAWSHASINLALDLWLLYLPASQVWNLNMSRWKRARVMFMFGFGILATIVSVIRLPTLRAFQATSNPTVDFWGVAVWSGAEISAALIVACMPGARMFVMHYLPRVVPTRRSHSTDATLAATPLPSSTSQGSTQVENYRKRPNVSPLALGSDLDLDKNRSYSMRVTVTSPRKSGPDSHSEGSQHEQSDEEAISIRESPTGQYLGVPQRLLNHTQEQGLAQGGILVTQDVSVVHSSISESRDVELGERKGSDETFQGF